MGANNDDVSRFGNMGGYQTTDLLTANDCPLLYKGWNYEEDDVGASNNVS